MLQLGPVYLNVLDLPRLSQFYQEVVGLSVLSKKKSANCIRHSGRSATTSDLATSH